MENKTFSYPSEAQSNPAIYNPRQTDKDFICRSKTPLRASVLIRHFLATINRAVITDLSAQQSNDSKMHCPQYRLQTGSNNPSVGWRRGLHPTSQPTWVKNHQRDHRPPSATNQQSTKTIAKNVHRCNHSRTSGGVVTTNI